MAGSHRDIAPPWETAEELAEFIEHAPVGLYWVDRDGRILWANRTALDLSGISEGGYVGYPVAERFTEPRACADILDRLERGKTVDGYEATLRTENGSVRRVLISANSLLRGGQPVHSRWVVRDVTALLEREQVARHRAVDASRLKDEFLALLSHELRTPLAAILVWLGLLRQGGSGAQDTARALEIIERSARTLERIIEDLLHASRIAAGGLKLSPQLVDLRGVVHVAVDAASGDATLKGLLFEASIGEVPIWVKGDPGRLQQAASNLLANAIKFTPAGGRVEARLDVADGQARLCVADTGEGISPDFLPFVFDRFRQQDSSSTRAHHGLGLGLYVVRDVIGQHGGVVSADSPGQGRGSAFTIRLPLAAASGAIADVPGAGEAHDRDDRVPVGLSVLLVDDEQDAREALRLILQQNGMVVTTATSAREALDLVGRVQPDLLLSDIAMPGEDGLSLMRRVRLLPFDRGGQIPAIAISAYASAEDRRRALLAGFQRHVPKPVNPANLLVTIAAVIRTTRAPRGEREEPGPS